MLEHKVSFRCLHIEGGAGGVVTSSGLAAVTMALTAFLNSGDHLLMVDSVYTPTRDFCETVLRRLGVETTYYDPLIGDSIAKLIRSNTRVVFTESPGSLTFEVQDIPAIAAVAHQRDALILMDNTWATPLFLGSGGRVSKTPFGLERKRGGKKMKD